MPKTIPGYKFIKAAGGISEYRLMKNDLAVLLMEDHSTPTATVMVTYRVGSRNEATGYTGATHILEHLLFKESKKFNRKNKKTITDVLDRIGARLNATTWLDRTNYFELVSSEHIETALSIEGDRMRNAAILEKDRQSEMPVVRNEFERDENGPSDGLDKQIWALAYQAHPYHHSTIGWRSDIEGVSTARLKEFYDTFYWPNNATVSVIGDFDTEKTLKLIAKHFGVHKKSPHPIPSVYTTEPPQEGPRRAVIKRAGQTKMVAIAHKTPEASHEDTPAIAVFSRIMGTGKASRLHRALVDKGLASDVHLYHYAVRDPALTTCYAVPARGVTHDEVEKVILKAYERVQTEGITPDELNRAKSQLRAAMVFARDGSFALSYGLSEAIASGDWTLYTSFLEKVERVTTEQVLGVARKYFIPDQSTTGHFVPKTAPEITPITKIPKPHRPKKLRTKKYV